MSIRHSYFRLVNPATITNPRLQRQSRHHHHHHQVLMVNGQWSMVDNRARNAVYSVSSAGCCTSSLLQAICSTSSMPVDAIGLTLYNILDYLFSSLSGSIGLVHSQTGPWTGNQSVPRSSALRSLSSLLLVFLLLSLSSIYSSVIYLLIPLSYRYLVRSPT